MKSRALSLAFAALFALPLIAADKPAAPASAAKTPKPQHIAMGEKIRLEDYVVAGKTTIFDFYSQYCPPCVAIAPELEKLHARRADVVVVKVDINRPGHRGIDWQSPVAQQYELRSVPHFKIYGPNGRLKADGDKAYETVIGMIN